jgi:hypothetical protein
MVTWPATAGMPRLHGPGVRVRAGRRRHSSGSCTHNPMAVGADDHDRELSAWLAEQGLGDAAILAVFGNKDLDTLDPDQRRRLHALRAARWELITQASQPPRWARADQTAPSWSTECVTLQGAPSMR